MTWGDTRYVIYAGENGFGLALIDEEVRDQIGYIQDRIGAGE